MRTNLLWLIMLIAPLSLTLTSCDDDDEMEISMLEALEADGRFTTLVSALEQTGQDGLLDFLDESTLFAPTDEAFANSGIDLGSLSDDELSGVILYHLVPAAIESGDIGSGQTYVSSSLAGNDNSRPGVSILVENSGGSITVNEATVIDPDLDTDLGVIHAIDGVLLPLDIVGHASVNSNFEELVGALGAASEDLVSVLQGEGPFTVFAPVNDAFEDISGVVAGLTPEQITDVLLYHVVSGSEVYSDQLNDGQEVTSANDGTFTVNINGNTVTITDSQGGEAGVILTDVQATNGVIHVLDKVIIPNL